MTTDLTKILTEKFTAAYGNPPAFIARAPGRLEILGNHTDYNMGFVLSAAVCQSTYFAIRPCGGNICKIFSAAGDYAVENFSINELDIKILGDWKNYIKGVICEIRKKGFDIGAFEAGVVSDIPLSAGMSSSAALEISACMAIEKAFGFEFSPIERAKIGQGAENNYIGVKTGLLDQFSSIFGRRDSLMLCDFRKNEVVRHVPLPRGFSIVVANSMIKHDLVDSDYNTRRESCENVVADIAKIKSGIKTLRDLSIEELESFRGKLNFLDYKRAKHILGENERVISAVSLLDSGDISSFGQLLFESHQSSKQNFENSCPELDYLVELAHSLPGCVGARLSGGGFGGITIHFVEEKETQNYMRRLSTAYKLKTGIEMQLLSCKSGDGAEWL